MKAVPVALSLVLLAPAFVDAQRRAGAQGEVSDEAENGTVQEGTVQNGTIQDGTVQDGTVTDGTVQDGTVTDGTVQDGTVADGTVPAPNTPPPLPSFLDTTDNRIEDTRPQPTPAQIAALREMEQELQRFERTGRSYRNTVVSLVRREYLRQRRGRNQYYDRQIRVEEGLVNEARATAIREFERFVATYPNDPTYTPDAMFRLGELYFERSATQFQEQYDAAQEQIDAGNEDVELPEQADFTPTIELYQRLIDNFPNYRRRDGVLYLIGYCLNELGRYAEALEAWHNLVCANRFTYDPQGFAARQAAEAQAMAEADAAAEADDTSPALDLVNEGEEEEPAPDLGFQDPYVGCRPVMEDAEFVTETWFRVGEYHFDDYGAE
ncbi:MAG: tetratricopeptide repeat protein, partial [Myxococcota bacterium]